RRIACPNHGPVESEETQRSLPRALPGQIAAQLEFCAADRTGRAPRIHSATQSPLLELVNRRRSIRRCAAVPTAAAAIRALREFPDPGHPGTSAPTWETSARGSS